jgi:putative membrane protein
MASWLIAVHVTGVVLWVGSLLAVALVLAQHTQETNAEARTALAKLERKILRAAGDPGATIAILTGIALVWTNSGYYFHARWLHLKLTFVLLLVGATVFLAISARRYAAGEIELRRRDAIMLFLGIALLLVLVLLATFPGSVYLT